MYALLACWWFSIKTTYSSQYEGPFIATLAVYFFVAIQVFVHQILYVRKPELPTNEAELMRISMEEYTSAMLMMFCVCLFYPFTSCHIGFPTGGYLLPLLIVLKSVWVQIRCVQCMRKEEGWKA